MSGIIVGPQTLPVEEGAKVLMAGGNAIDAAITCAFVQGIVDPQMCGIGGYAELTLQLAGQEMNPIHMDAPAIAGSLVTPEMWVNKVIGANPDGWGFFLEGKVNDAGYTSVCTPGWVKGMSTILDRWGTISWAQAIAPAARIAEEGFKVSAALSRLFRRKSPYPQAVTMREYIERNPEASRIYFKNGELPDMGETFRNPDFAATLRHLAEKGPDDFYNGELAAKMTGDLAANGSFVTKADFQNYKVRDNQPVMGSYRGYEIASGAAPHGGPTLLAILNILEGYDLAAMGHNSAEYIYTVAMAMKAAFADRNPLLGDPDFVDVPLDWMMSKERAAQWRAKINAGEPIEVDFTSTGTPTTTHVSVVDKWGNCVALTHSLGASSGVITPGLGFMYNNSMINFHPYPGHPNSIAPTKSRTTGMCPTIIYKGGKPVVVLGAPGATRIITSCLQVILNILDFGMSASEATHAARFDCQANDIRCHARIPEYVCAEVRKRHPIMRLAQSHGAFGLVHAITIDPSSGKLAGGADTGADGMALLV